MRLPPVFRRGLPAGLVLLGFGVALDVAASPLRIDGRIDEEAWTRATLIDDFVVTQPLTRAVPGLRTEARLLSLPAGLAVAITSHQPSAIAPANAGRRARDASPMASDLVYVMVDFDAAGVRAYEFMVGRGGAQRDGTWTNEVEPSLDWDGRWQAAVHDEGEAWHVEMLIPWSVVPMREAADGRRTIALNVGRYVDALGERHAWPAISFQEQRYVSRFGRLEVDAHRERALELVPYAAVGWDAVSGEASTRAGLDLAWRPGPALQLIAALQPDFGQVESDDLVINFDAIETFFSDKRPFFTENQTLFDLATPQGGQLLYTRRVGGASDDGSGRAAEVDLALKLGGSAVGLDYGAFVAEEEDASGRRFGAIRLLRPGDRLQVGYLGTWADRPLAGREAWVHAIDARVRPIDEGSLEAQMMRSEVALDGVGRSDAGVGAWVRWQQTLADGWAFDAAATRLDARFDIDDLGFLPRNDLVQLDIGLRRRREPVEGGESSVTWRLDGSAGRNLAGDRLQPSIVLGRLADLRGGGLRYTELRWDPPGGDDLLTRGNGLVRRPARLDLWHYQQGPWQGRWKWLLGGWALQEGLGGRAFQLESRLDLQANPSLLLSAEVYPRWSRDWLVWREGTLLARYAREQLFAELGAEWFPAPRHAWRLKAQWLAIDAVDARAARVGDDGRVRPSGESIDDLQVASFGLQLRYRWEIGPQRELYVVYGRGGFLRREERGNGVLGLFDDATALRDSDQWLVKLRWAFGGGR